MLEDQVVFRDVFLQQGAVKGTIADQEITSKTDFSSLYHAQSLDNAQYIEYNVSIALNCVQAVKSVYRICRCCETYVKNENILLTNEVDWCKLLLQKGFIVTNLRRKL